MLSGQQVILDLYNCHYESLKNLSELEQILKDTMDKYGLKPIASYTQQYEDNNNLSVVVFYDKGHLIVHAYPETGFASVDALSTVTNIALEKTVIKIKQLLGAEKTKTTHIKRGDFGKLNDMKPTIHKKIKTWKRVRNTSVNVLKLFVNKKKNQQTD